MLRVLPWITDGAVSFLDGFLFRNKNTHVFEFGMGNSTLYFLTKGCIVTAVDHDPNWVELVEKTADNFQMGDRLMASCLPRPYLPAYQSNNYSIVAIDGRDRVECLKHVLDIGINDSTILLLDNTERVNGGRYVEYQSLLNGFQQIHFEQPCVPGVPPDTGNYNDRSGNRVTHRWITTVAYKSNNFMLTTTGNQY